MTLLGKVRLRVLVFAVGVPLAAVTTIAMAPSWAALPLVGVAVYTLALGVQKAAGRLHESVCWTCGASLAGRPAGAHGVECPGCGTLNSPAGELEPDEALADLDEAEDERLTA